MNDSLSNEFDDSRIRSNRGPKNSVSADRPYGWLVEKELTAEGNIEETGIIFLTNRECTFTCLMCDLWKNTTDQTVPAGAITHQIEYALGEMPEVKNLKLYNSGSFFDVGAIPPQEYGNIASLLSSMDNIIVESHPRLISENCLRFKKMLRPNLEVAMGLETVNTDVLTLLNKKMTIIDFCDSVSYLKNNGIGSRAFILLRPPFMSEKDGIYWAKRSIDFAFDAGAGCCTVIPVRGGNGTLEILAEKGVFSTPSINSLEDVLEYGISLGRGRVFADTWDLRGFSACSSCLESRIARITEMNLSQMIGSPVCCDCKD